MFALKLHRAALLLLATAVLLGCWVVPFDQPARAQVESGLQRALTAFAAARALGAVISVAQGTQLDVTPGGFGVSLAPGQALQPLNELVDRFGAIMLAASVAFGIQLLLLNIGAHALVSGLASAAVLLWLVLRWRGDDARAGRWLQPVLVTLLLVRFAVPLSALANEAVYRTFMADEYHAALATIEKSPASVSGRALEPNVGGEGLVERIRNWWKGLPDVKAGYDAILNAASDWTTKMVRLMALFILQTMVLPIAFLAAAWWTIRWAMAGLAPRR